MTDLLIRDVPDNVVRELERRAAARGHSLEAEHRAILEAAVKPWIQPDAPDPNGDFWEEARKLREETKGRITTESWELIREDRDSR